MVELPQLLEEERSPGSGSCVSAEYHGGGGGTPERGEPERSLASKQLVPTALAFF